MSDTRTTEVTALGEQSIRITRRFNAPQQLVFDAFTKPELIQRWMGSNFGDWSWASCDVDLREGGAYRYVWQQPDGTQMAISGTYREVTPPTRTVSTQVYDGMTDFGEMLVTIMLTERDGETLLEEIVQYPSREARDTDLQQVPEGREPGFATLDQVLASV